jgi:hydroxyacylglutathione hydrolase
MYFKQFYEPRLAQYSYLVACPATGEALVIDPLRDIDSYLQEAEARKFRITHVTETHIHADFLSGARDLARATGASLLLSDEGGPDWLYAFSHQGLKDGDTFRVGNVVVEVMHTPGHTPEHLTFLIYDTAASPDQPAMAVTGDFVFVGDIGRPDLLELAAGVTNTSEPMARQMFQSLQRFKALPDDMLIWPGHGAGSACGKALGAVPVSSLGYEKRANWAFQIEDEATFVRRLLADQPDPPRYFANMKVWNRSGEKAFQPVPHPRRLSIQELERFQHDAEVVIVDTRDKRAFACGHIPGSINIQNIALFTTWAGRLLSYDHAIALIAAAPEAPDLARALYRIGMDRVVGFFEDMEYWRRAGQPLVELRQITPQALRPKLEGDEVVVVDVREAAEYRQAHIPGAISIPGGRLPEHMTTLPRHKPIVFYCGSGDRSCIAASLVMGQGYDNVLNLADGFLAWLDLGYPVISDEAS